MEAQTLTDVLRFICGARCIGSHEVTLKATKLCNK